MYCEYCTNEWTEFYDLRDITLDSNRNLPDGSREPWLFGKEIVSFEFPYGDDTKTGEYMIHNFRQGDTEWWESHNKALNFIDVEENIDGMTDKHEDCRFTRVSLSYYRESVDCQFDALQAAGVPNALLQQFKDWLKIAHYYMEIIACHETGEIDIYADPHKEEHLACFTKHGEETGNRYVHVFLKYPNEIDGSGDSFYCEDRDAVFEALQDQDIPIDRALDVQRFLECFFWCFKNGYDDEENYWLRYIGKNKRLGGIHNNHYYQLYGVEDTTNNLYDAKAIVVFNGETQQYPLRDFVYEPETVNMDPYTVGKHAIFLHFGLATILDYENLTGKFKVGHSDGFVSCDVHESELIPVHHFIIGDNDTVFCLDVNGYVLHRIYGKHADKEDDDRRDRFSINEYRYFHNDQWEYDMYYGSPKSPMPIRYLDSFNEDGEVLDPMPGHYKHEPWAGVKRQHDRQTTKEVSIHELGPRGAVRLIIEQLEDYSDNQYVVGYHTRIKESIEYIKNEWLPNLDKSKDVVTFKEFRESRRHCASDSKFYEGHSGACFRYGDDEDEIAICGPEGKFWLVIENQEYLSHNLMELEIELYVWRHVNNA
jgi:hypothetical protein